MLVASEPSKFDEPFATSAGGGYIRAIPTASQIGITDGAASLADGFPPLNFLNVAAGGVPPFGQDMNGILNEITAISQWQNAGGLFKFSSTYATTIGGYPKGAVLRSAASDAIWMSLADSNSNDPDATTGYWTAIGSTGLTAVTGLTNANVTLTGAQASRNIITFAGTLTGNVQIIFPTVVEQWVVVNNTTGAYSLTCKTAAGTGVIVSQATSLQIYCGGTNISAGTTATGFGVGQTWTDVTGSRVGTTVYTNSTAAPIEVALSLAATSGSPGADIYVGAVKIYALSFPYGVNAASFAVPSGATYHVDLRATTTIDLWTELR